ncbi:MAG: FAD-dependent oxidoreductase [Caulobacteraceae bacterium]|nr:FAD-dependent oxidoreductase [Caulobacteraceae bacterium]
MSNSGVIPLSDFDVIVIGAGPGGYVTAIRASQLGLKTAIVEREALGGICLNWGCIPTKALLKSAELYEQLDHLEAYGLSVTGRAFDFGKIIERSRGVAKQLTAGVAFLMKKHKIAVHEGVGTLTGKGKLSKRDGLEGGFPVFPLDWTDPATGDTTRGFREMGFLPEAFVNMLAMLGWNDGSGREILDIDELVATFAMDRVHKGGARFDFEKAKWFNQEWIRRSTTERLLPLVDAVLRDHGVAADEERLALAIPLVKERCVLLTDFVAQSAFLFRPPPALDLDAVTAKWTPQKERFFLDWSEILATMEHDWKASGIETSFQQAAAAAGIKAGELQLPLRVMLVGGKYGPPVFTIAEMLGQRETYARIRRALQELGVPA